MPNSYRKTYVKPATTLPLKKIGFTSFILSLLLVSVNTLPANATDEDITTEMFKTANEVKKSSQTLIVSTNAVNTTIVRDSYGATSQEEINARLAAEAEAARLKALAEEQALRDAQMAAVTSGNYSPVAVAPGQVIPAESIIAAAQQWVGVVPYGNGNHPSDSFSCDGYVQYVFAQNGISLPRGADAQGKSGTIISENDAQAGDLVWWPGQHIGIYDGAGGFYDSPDWGRTVQHRVGFWGSPVFVRL